MIDSYAFGRMAINGKDYSKDLIIYPDGQIQDSWLRKEGHILFFEDISRLIDSKPEVIIAGTGAYGIMKPGEGLAAQLKGKGITFYALPSKRAMELFNQLFKEKKTGACFHLTC